MAADFKSLGKFEQGALVAGAVAIILSFIPKYVVVSIDGGKDIPGLSFSSGINAWHGWAFLGMLLVLAAVAIVAGKAFAVENLPDGVPWNLVAAAAAGLGTILIVIRAFTVGDGGLDSVDVGPGWSGWLLFLATIALTAFTFLSFKESGEKMPDLNKKNDTPPAPPAA